MFERTFRRLSEDQVINIEAVIRHFGEEALRLQLEIFESTDRRALQILDNRTALDRSEGIRGWLQKYMVFQGIGGPTRLAIATAVVEWADSCDLQRDLTSVNALAAAHGELNDKVKAVCTRASGKERDFTSLASKALWLCYPDSVPIFDSFTQRALWVISKLEPDIIPVRGNEPEYRKFVHIWKALYERCADALNRIDVGNYPYRVRIFDKILWLIGEQHYGVG
jgi:hypothetical protein